MELHHIRKELLGCLRALPLRNEQVDEMTGKLLMVHQESDKRQQAAIMNEIFEKKQRAAYYLHKSQ